jgi:hypothetical protein
MFLRIISSIVIMALGGFVSAIYSPMATLAVGKAAGWQMAPNDTAYLTSMYTMSFFSSVNILITGIVLFLLALIWVGPLTKIVKRDLMTIIILGLSLSFISVHDAKAYYDKTDYTEAYTILPNESAIYVPDTGDNKTSQVKFDSEDYLKANQVPAKRFIVPHQKLSGSGSYIGWGDYYIPAGRLFIVDRTTYSHEWVGKGRGSNSTLDESFPCQSKEGLDISVGVSVGSSVKEENAAKYLYNFGVAMDAKREAARNDPQMIFASVYYSRKLADVMADTGRKVIQTIVCGEITSRTFDQANSEANKIMENVSQKAKDYLASVGITLNFIGWADTFTFSPDVQKAVNDRFMVEKLGGSLAVLTAIANLRVQEGLATGMDKHGLPMVITPDILNVITGLAAKPNATQTSTVPKTAQ